MKQSLRTKLFSACTALAVSASASVALLAQSGVRFITVEPGVRLEVKDWGGQGRAVVLLAGLGGTLHVYDQFAPILTKNYHVYGITRRGYGASSAPAPNGNNYAADKLGDDVLSVLDQLHLQHPILIGHSFAGEELSSVGSRFPDRVGGLIYLDAAYRYAYSPVGRGDFRIDTLELERVLADSLSALSPEEGRSAIQTIENLLPQFQSDLSAQEKLLSSEPEMSKQEYATAVKEQSTKEGKIEAAALNGERRYTQIRCPILAIFALPHDHGLPPGPKRDQDDALDIRAFGPLADSFEAGVPSAKVVRIAHAQHAIFKSNPSEVRNEIQKFIDALPPD